MGLEFSKMHGLGNDFMVIDLISQRFNLNADLVRKLANPHFGIGFDQLLIVEAPSRPDVDFRYRIFNADGSEVAQCGNGARCFGRFVRDRKLTRKHLLRVETASGIIVIKVQDDHRVTVDMGLARLEPMEVPFIAPARSLTYSIEVNGDTLSVGVVSMGNPHVVLQVTDVDTARVSSLGPALESHPRFPERVNVGFMQVVDRSTLRLRVFERGAGETLACGTGACAAVVSARLQNLVNEHVRVVLPGGELDIHYAGEGHPVMMTGPASRVFDGIVRLNEL